jgi:predicted permease
LLDVLDVTTPIFLIVAAGYIAVRIGLISSQGIRALVTYLVYFGLPALLFKAISQRDLSQIIHIDFLIAYGAGSLLAFFILFLISRHILSQDLTESALFGMGGSFSNSLLVGFPMLSITHGELAAIILALVLLIENFLMLPLTLAVADFGHHRQAGFFSALVKVIPTVVKNPFILAIVIGVVFSMFRIDTPLVASQVIDFFAHSVTAIGLFAIGGILVGFDYNGQKMKVSLIVVTKLIIHPLMVWMVFVLIPESDPTIMVIGVILASMPMFSMFTVIGERYGMGQICAASLIPATVLSFFSISFVIWMTA